MTDPRFAVLRDHYVQKFDRMYAKQVRATRWYVWGAIAYSSGFALALVGKLGLFQVVFNGLFAAFWIFMAATNRQITSRRWKRLDVNKVAA